MTGPSAVADRAGSAAQVPCPFMGLGPYTEADQRFFFGREREERVIAANVRASRLTVLCGPSGVGKTSVLLARVVPALRTLSSALIVVRDWQGTDALATLQRTCQDALAAANATAAPSLSLDDMVAALAEAVHGQVFLILDQFEEHLLDSESAPGVEAFDEALARIVNREDIPVGVLLSLRDDSLAALDRLGPRIPNILGHVLRVQHLDLEAAERAIRQPLRVLGQEGGERVTIEDELVQEVLLSVRTSTIARTRMDGMASPAPHPHDRVETPFLQLVLVRLWMEDIGAGGRVLRLETLRRLGGANRIVRRHLDDAMDQLTVPQQEACSRLFAHMVTPTGNKVACARDDLAQYAGHLAGEVPQVLAILQRARVVRHVPAPPGQLAADQYQIFHDVLSEAILDWQRRHRARLARQQRFRRLLWRAAAVALGVGIAIVLLWRSGVRLEAKRLEDLGKDLQQRKEFPLAAQQFGRAAALYSRALDREGTERARDEARVAEEQYKPWGFLEDLRTATVRELRGDAVRVGRNIPEVGLFNEISFPDRQVSRRHVEFRRSDQFVEDFRSSYGTTVNATYLEYGQGRKLTDGDVVVLGGSQVLRFRTQASPPGGARGEAWAAVVDGGSREVVWLVGSQHSVSLSGERLKVSQGLDANALLWIRRDRNEIMTRSNVWKLHTTLLVPGQLGAIAEQLIRDGVCRPDLTSWAGTWVYKTNHWSSLGPTNPMEYVHETTSLPFQIVILQAEPPR